MTFSSSFEVFNPDDEEVAKTIFFREFFTADLRKGTHAFISREYNTSKSLGWLLRQHKKATVSFTANDPSRLYLVCAVSFRGEKISVLLERGWGKLAWTKVRAISADDRVLNAYVKWLDHLIPKRPKPREREEAVVVDFLFQGALGKAHSISRELEAPTWKEIKANYSKAAAPALGKLIKTDLNTLNGKFGVLHGPAGTGKTSYLRALMQAWRKQAKFTYVMDAEDFFRDAKYMVQVIFDNLQHEKDRWNVILCEDAEEFIAPNAKKDVGQALSRLLNLGDGMLGQGLQLLFLFTTNAKLDELHPAMIRKGRCFSNVLVPELTAAEATEWLKCEVTQATTLADLYAMKAETTAGGASE